MSDPDPFEGETHFKELAKGDPHYEAVGRIASAWARFEFLVDQTIWQLANIDSEHGACITAQLMGAGARLRSLLALVDLQKEFEPKLQKDLIKFNNCTTGLTDQRNRFIHDCWMAGRKTGKVAQLRVTANKKLDYGFRLKTLEELNNFHEKIIQHRMKFSTLQTRIYAEIHFASFEKRRQRQAAPQNSPKAPDRSP